MKTFRSGLAVAALLTSILPAGAQKAPAPPSVFGEQIEVRVVNVEAVVVDRQGNRVAGLKPGDFRLEVDGKPVSIEYFNEIRGGQAIAPGPGEESSPVKGLPSLAPGSPVGTSYLVFIDDFFSLSPRRDELLRGLKGQLSRLGPEDRMAIVAWDGGRVEMLSSWSNSDRQLGAAIEKALGRRAYGVARLAELRTFEGSRRLTGDRTEAGPRASFQQRIDLEEIEFSQRLAGQTERAVAAAASALRGFASPPGRKVMLLLSGGWPFSAVDYVLDNPNRPNTERVVPTGEEIFRPLVDTANRLGYTLYPVDVPGIEGSTVDAGFAGPSRNAFNLREQEHEASLRFVAEQTGGRALINSASAELLQAAETDTRSYYWLGFTPAWQGNDKRHKVAVVVLPKGLKVRSRTDFLDLSRKAETSMIVESAMLFGNAPDARTISMKVGAPAVVNRKEMDVPVSLAIPVDALTFVPIEGKYTSELELRVSAVDAGGNRSPVPMVLVSLRSAEQPKAGTFVRYDTKIRMRRMPHHVMMALFDPLSGKILTGEADVAPPQK
jgi:VWFA-related protein